MNDSDRIKELEAEVARLKAEIPLNKSETALLDKMLIRIGKSEMKSLVLEGENLRLSEQLGKSSEALKDLLDNLPFGLETAESITVTNANGIKGTMGLNMTRALYRASVNAKDCLTSLSKG